MLRLVHGLYSSVAEKGIEIKEVKRKMEEERDEVKQQIERVTISKNLLYEQIQLYQLQTPSLLFYKGRKLSSSLLSKPLFK